MRKLFTSKPLHLAGVVCASTQAKVRAVLAKKNHLAAEKTLHLAGIVCASSRPEVRVVLAEKNHLACTWQPKKLSTLVVLDRVAIKNCVFNQGIL